MRDVAREVGLSVTTVSRALNGFDDVAEVTRKRILDTAHALDYHPNAVAQSLQTSRANAVGLVIPPRFHRAFDAFWLEFIAGMAAVCVRREMDLVLSAIDSVHELNNSFRRLVRGRRVDGLVLCDIRSTDPRIEYLQKHRLPFVAFGRTTGEQNYPYIDVDGAAGVSHAMEHLISLGHRRIAYLDIDPAFSFSHFRMAGYRSALKRAQIPFDPDLVCGCLTSEDAPNAITRLFGLSNPPSAVFAAADYLALAVLNTARELHLSIPQDLSLAVFDDSITLQQTGLGLTAVSQPNRLLGEEAAELLLDRVSSPDSPLAQRLIVPSLVIRRSTASFSEVSVRVASTG